MGPVPPAMPEHHARAHIAHPAGERQADAPDVIYRTQRAHVGKRKEVGSRGLSLSTPSRDL